MRCYVFTAITINVAEVLITGICDSGKTTILCQLVAGSTRQTYTSMQHNTFPFPVDNKPPVQLVDVPGSDRVRGQVACVASFLMKLISLNSNAF